MLNPDVKLNPKIFDADILPSQVLRYKIWDGEQEPTRAGYGLPPTFSTSMWHVYVLESKIDGEKYVGITNNLKRRLAMHNSGKVFATRDRFPFHIIYIETLLNQHDAAAREKFLKSGWGKNYISRTLKHYYLESRKSLESKGLT